MDFFLNMNVKYIKIAIMALLVLVLVIAIKDRDNESVQVISSKTVETSNEIPIYSVEPENDEKVIAITFNAAWGVEDLDKILEILNKHNAKVTFFVTGEWASNFPEGIKKIYEAGHDIGNHGAMHKHMPQLSYDEMMTEINGCGDVVYNITGKKMTLFRAPYGDYNEYVVEVAKDAGYQTIQWDVDSLDWKEYGIEPMTNAVCQHKDLKNGSIILMHTGTKYTADSIDGILSNLEAQGYTFVKVSDLVYEKDYIIDHTGRQSKK